MSNQPAFPVDPNQDDSEFMGMSLRDAIAIAAMQGCLGLIAGWNEDSYEARIKEIVSNAYRVADAALVERDK